MDVARRVQHTNDIDAIVQRLVEDDVPAEWQAAHSWREFIPGLWVEIS